MIAKTILVRRREGGLRIMAPLESSTFFEAESPVSERVSCYLSPRSASDTMAAGEFIHNPDAVELVESFDEVMLAVHLAGHPPINVATYTERHRPSARARDRDLALARREQHVAQAEHNKPGSGESL